MDGLTIQAPLGFQAGSPFCSGDKAPPFASGSGGGAADTDVGLSPTSFDVWKVEKNGEMQLMDSFDDRDPAPGVYYVFGNGKRYEVQITGSAAASENVATSLNRMWSTLIVLALLVSAICFFFGYLGWKWLDQSLAQLYFMINEQKSILKKLGELVSGYMQRGQPTNHSLIGN
jgi:hypothetical protein